MAFQNVFKKKQVEIRSAWEEYREIIHRHQTPKAGDEAAMERLVEVLHLTPERLEADAAAVVALQLANAAAVEVNLHQTAHTDATKALRVHQAETQRIIEQRTAREAELQAVVNRTNAKAMGAAEEAGKADKIFRDFPHLFAERVIANAKADSSYLTLAKAQEYASVYPGVFELQVEYDDRATPLPSGRKPVKSWSIDKK